ncbi:hypothetical protein [Nostoc sp.]|uniref:hypothetical protein n=1 Tax=Nostoc sp. TaxID=1180 RepID=UPI002FF78440
MSYRKKMTLKVFLDSLPNNYPKNPLFLIIYSCLLFVMVWIIITFSILLFVIIPLGFIGLKDFIYECKTLEYFNEISTTCTTKGWVTFIHNIVSFLITVFIVFSPTTLTKFDL